jgi:hypothetical protein
MRPPPMNPSDFPVISSAFPFSCWSRVYDAEALETCRQHAPRLNCSASLAPLREMAGGSSTCHTTDTRALRSRIQTPLAEVRTSPTSQIKTQEGVVACA